MSYPSVESGGKCQQLFFFANFAEVWEIKQRVVLDMAADRGAYIDQSQSLILVQSWNLSVQWDVGCSILQVQQHSKEMVCNGAMQLFLVSSTLSVSLYFTLKLHHWFPWSLRNIHMVDATTAKLSSMHFHGWQLGLKTGLYYLRTKAAVDAIKFTVDVETLKRSSSDSDGSLERQGLEGYDSFFLVGAS